MLKIDQFWQHVKSATFSACCTIWRQCPIADIIDLGQCHLAVAATNVVRSERVSRPTKSGSTGKERTRQ